MPAPYDTLDLVTAAARARLLDSYSAAGEMLKDSDASTLAPVNAGWRKMQEFLSKLGFQKFSGQTVLLGLEPAAGSDPAAQSRLDWNGFFDGGGNDAAIKLPSDFITPIGIDERIRGSLSFLEMDNFSEDGLPLVPRQPWNKAWEWRGDAIYFPGALQVTDIRLRYWSFAADFVPYATKAFNLQPVPVVRCLEAFACFICAEVARARGDMDGKQFTADGEAACMILVGRENPAAVAPPAAPVEGAQ